MVSVVGEAAELMAKVGFALGVAADGLRGRVFRFASDDARVAEAVAELEAILGAFVSTWTRAVAFSSSFSEEARAVGFNRLAR
jgi:hypothetical protein